MKMHLYITTRGIKHDVDRFINDLQAQYFEYPHPEQDKKPLWVQLGVRPIQFWELVLPKESMPSLMKTLWGTNPEPHPKFKYQLGIIRRLLGAQKLPTFDEKLLTRIIYKNNVAIYPIGVKDDAVIEGIERL